jgi:hypothetical protein
MALHVLRICCCDQCYYCVLSCWYSRVSAHIGCFHPSIHRVVVEDRTLAMVHLQRLCLRARGGANHSQFKGMATQALSFDFDGGEEDDGGADNGKWGRLVVLTNGGLSDLENTDLFCSQPTYVLGRSARDCQIRLRSQLVSGKHLRLERRPAPSSADDGELLPFIVVRFFSSSSSISSVSLFGFFSSWEKGEKKTKKKTGIISADRSIFVEKMIHPPLPSPNQNPLRKPKLDLFTIMLTSKRLGHPCAFLD